MLNPNLTFIDNPKFTTGMMGDFFRFKLTKRSLALSNLLARMQMNATAPYPSISQQQEVLSKFYDMSFEVVPQVMGPEIVLSYVTNFVEPLEVLDPDYTYKTIYHTFEQMVHHPLINEEILELSKKQLEDEYREVMEEPSSYALDQFFRIWYKDRPDYQDSFMGDIKEIKKLKVRDMVTFAKTLRMAATAKLGVLRRSDSLEDLIWRREKHLEYAGIIQSFDIDEMVNIPAGTEENIYKEEDVGNLQAQIYMGYGYRKNRDQKYEHIKDIATNYKKRIAGLVLSQYLAGDQSSKLFTTIREELGAAYQVGANSYHRNSLFLINTGVAPDKVNEVIEIIKQEMARVQKGEIDEHLLRKAKKSLVNMRLVAEDRENWQLSRVLRNEMFEGYASVDEEYSAIVKNISPKALADFAKDLFLKESYVLK